MTAQKVRESSTFITFVKLFRLSDDFVSMTLDVSDPSFRYQLLIAQR